MVATTWPITSQSNSIRTAARCCLTVGFALRVCRSSTLFAQFEADGMSGFPRTDGGPIDGHTMRGQIFDLQADHIVAVDGQSERGQIPVRFSS